MKVQIQKTVKTSSGSQTTSETLVFDADTAARKFAILEAIEQTVKAVAHLTKEDITYLVWEMK